MRRELFVGRQNQISDLLDTSADNGATFTAVNLPTMAEVILQVYCDPASPLLEQKAVTTHSSQFTLAATGIVVWTPAVGVITAAMVGDANLRWIVQAATATGGTVFEAPPVTIKP